MSDYLLPTPTGYTFRVRIPKALQPVFGKRELKKALKTTDKVYAKRLASVFAMQAQNLFDSLLARSQMSKLPFLNAHHMMVIQPSIDGKEGTKFDLDKDRLKEQLEQLIALKLIRPLPDESLPSEKPEEPLPEKQIFTANDTPSVNLPKKTTKPTEMLLSKAVDLYIADKTTSGDWRPGSDLEQRASFRLLTECIGDQPLSAIDRSDAQRFLEILTKYPKNKNKMPQYRELSLSKILKMDIPTEDLLSVSSVNQTMERIAALFNWLMKLDYVSRNPFTQLRITGKAAKKRSKGKRLAQDNEERLPFTREDLAGIFDTEFWIYPKREDPFKYWVPLISLYTGARLNEICQLQKADITTVDGLPCISITDEGDENKSIKTDYGIRTIPIHSKLLELGFLRFVEKTKDRLFPECEYYDKKGTYSKKASRWFGYCKKVGKFKISEPLDKKAFHSFRHTFISELKKLDVGPEMRSELAGHSYEAEKDAIDSMSVKRYADRYSVTKMQVELEKLDFEVELSSVKPYVR